MLKNKRILVTGACGFIGSHLVQELVKQGGFVRALVLYNSFGSMGCLERLDGIEVIAGDIRDQNICRKIVEDIDVVFHLAGLIAIPYSYLAPSSYIETNVNGVANLCQAALDAGVERFVHVSSSEVYGSARFVPMDESHPLQPQSPYSASKIGGESIALSYFYSFGLPVTVVRPFNTYGPRQSARAVIPSIIGQAALGQRIAIGNMAPTRDFMYVDDLCLSMMALAECREAVGEVVNVGSGVEISIGDLARKIGMLCGVEVECVEEVERKRPERSEVYRLCCNADKLWNLTAFRPQVGLDEGLRRTIAWYAGNPLKGGFYHV